MKLVFWQKCCCYIHIICLLKSIFHTVLCFSSLHTDRIMQTYTKMKWFVGYCMEYSSDRGIEFITESYNRLDQHEIWCSVRLHPNGDESEPKPKVLIYSALQPPGVIKRQISCFTSPEYAVCIYFGSHVNSLQHSHWLNPIYHHLTFLWHILQKVRSPNNTGHYWFPLHWFFQK